MTTTPNMGLVLPVDGGSPNVWNTILDTLFFQIDSHNHTAGQGVQVPTLGLGINADLTFATNSAIHLKASVFDEVAAAAVAAYSDALFVSSADHNLYFRNNGGVNVQLTNGNTINVSLVGGIGGDYAAVNALVQYNDAARQYWLQQEGAPRPWAKLGTGDISLYQAAASIVNAVILKSPNALAAPYTLTFPAALPASPSPLYSDASGNLSYSRSVTLKVPVTTFANVTSTPATYSPFVNDRVAVQFSSDANILSDLPLQVGDVITAVTMYVKKGSGAGTTLTLSLNRNDITSDTAGTQDTQGSGTTSAAAPGYVTLTLTGLSRTVTAGFQTAIALAQTGTGSTADFIMGAEITVTRS